MNGILTVTWRIEPIAPPRPFRHCSACGSSQYFHSSGRIRLNANGRRLDAWLIYKCISCDKTWNRPLVERASVASIAETELHAMHASDPAWVRIHEFDTAALGRYCEKADVSGDLRVTKNTISEWTEAWSAIEIAISARYATGMRLDRLLASELGLVRSELGSMQQLGGLLFDSDSGRILKRPVYGGFALQFVASRLSASQRSALSAGIQDLWS